MNITPVSENNIAMQGKNNPNWFKRQIRRVEQKILDKLPSHTTKESTDSRKNWDKASHWVGDPMWNRGIMGVSALMTQPAIDYYNHRVDDETRTVSRNRTIAKIVAGTLVGMFAVRGPVYKLVEKMTNVSGKTNFSKKLLPKKYFELLKENESALKNYRSSVAMAFALMAMCVTNFVLDAPLTVILTNYLNRKSGVSVNNLEQQRGPNINEGFEGKQTVRSHMEVMDA